MTARGIHFALTDDEVRALCALREDERPSYLFGPLLEACSRVQPPLLAESDKAWDAMQRALTDGTLDPEAGTYPLSRAIVGGESLCVSEHCIVSLKTPNDVRDIAQALDELTEEEFRDRYFAINPRSYDGDIGEEDFEYTWSWLESVRDLFFHAAELGRAVVFAADQ